jgi:hypothetical protein
MNLTISLEEPLAEQLRRQASARDLSPEQAAREILGGALNRIADEEACQASNRRRAELIGKSRDLGLTTEEGNELDRLQAAVDQRLAPMDRRLLAVAEEFRQLAERLPDATAP